MLNYIKSELYRTTHRKYPYVLVGTSSLICILVNVLALWFMKDQAAVNRITMPDMLMINRTKIYLGKFIVEVIVATVSLIIVATVLILSSYICLGLGGATMAETLGNFGNKLIAVFPLWLTGIAIANLLAFNIKNNNIFAFAYLGVVAIFPGIIKLLGYYKPIFAKIQLYLVSYNIKFIVGQDRVLSEDITKFYVLGIVYITLITVIGIISFRRREIK